MVDCQLEVTHGESLLCQCKLVHQVHIDRTVGDLAFVEQPGQSSLQAANSCTYRERDRGTGLIVGIIHSVNREGMVAQCQGEQVDHLPADYRCAIQVCPDTLHA